MLFSSLYSYIIFHVLKVEFLNEKSERCRIIFSSMHEEYQMRKRNVFRKHIDSSLPSVRIFPLFLNFYLIF